MAKGRNIWPYGRGSARNLGGIELDTQHHHTDPLDPWLAKTPAPSHQ